MKKTVNNIVGIEIDENYKWKDTLFIDDTISTENIEDYKKCSSYIKLKFNKTIDFSEARMIEKNIYGCEKYIYDCKRGAKIYFEKENICIIETNQEANEWLIIMLQVMLLKEGYSFIHAAAVSKEMEAIVLPSWGGVGKTASVAKLIKQGYKLLGDDLNIIAENGNIYGFPKKFVLYFYHKELFPEVFNKKELKCNSVLNNFYTKIIPTVKEILRKFPTILAYARKHNPQSMKISPTEIFGKEKIEKNSQIKQIIWIERTKNKNQCTKCETKELAMKAVSVTINEIFNENINAILIMCGFNIVKYEDIFEKMYKIYENALKGKIANKLEVPMEKNVSCVAEEVMKNIDIKGKI